jgi:formylglycine-generating enzyme required for sulfatase activity
MRPGNPKVNDVEGLATLLKRSGVEFGAEDIADALWLARHMGDLPGSNSRQDDAGQNTGSAQANVREEFVENDEDEDEANLAQLSLPSRSSQGARDDAIGSGIPIKAPAAPALRIRLDLARALRPLRKKVPAVGQLEVDEDATIERIADQRIWSPVLKPAPERWLDVALVVEDTESLPLWEETISEFQTLLERQGAFRRVTTWRLQAEPGQTPKLFPNWQDPIYGRRPTRARQLFDPAGRRLILLLSDCTSSAWPSGPLLTWLNRCCEQAPTTVVQLLSQRLWSQSALSQGTPVWLSALEAGTVTAKLNAEPQSPLLQQLLGKPAQTVTIPVVTLEADPLKQWAKVVAGSGETRTIGYQFDLQAIEARPASDPEADARTLEPASAEERVRWFRTTASGIAQQLAELMSVAPVSPPIVDLIRQTLLRKAGPVHVAEVFMGGLMQARTVSGTEPGKPPSLEFDFAPGVRTILSDAVPRSVTATVLNAVSSYIAERLGLNIKTFDALLRLDFQGDRQAEDLVIPFAEVAAQILERMGGEYAVIAAQLSIQPKVAPPPPEPDPDDLYPLLQTFKFREATLVFENQSDVLPERDVMLEQQFIDALGEGVRPELVEFETASIGSRLPVVGFIDDVETILRELDHLLGSQSPPQRLKSVQKTILRGTWEGQSYDEIAVRNDNNAASLKRQGTQLWQMLSKALGENITKGNARNVLIQWTTKTGETGLTISRSTRRSWQYVESLGNGVELEMVVIPAGSFVMGAPEEEEGRSADEGPQYEVTIAEPFFMGKYPITQAQWRIVAAMPQVERELDPDPSRFKGDSRPVEQVSWLDAVEFCRRLERATGRPYRLPSEAEWEYACRAGTTTPFHFGETITTDLANYRGTDWQVGETTYSGAYGRGPHGEYRKETTDVGIFPANAFGLYDMHGNVWEWCQDWWHESYEGAPVDGSAWIAHGEEDEERRVLRGGSWDFNPEDCRSALRFRDAPVLTYDGVGCRVVCGLAR